MRRTPSNRSASRHEGAATYAAAPEPCPARVEEAIRVEGVTFTHAGSKDPVWVDLSCSFDRGKVHVIAGPSGCGKSTLLQAINGLVPHVNEGRFSGRVLCLGEDVTDETPRSRCRRIGYVMQDPESQFCTFTVGEELAFGQENLGIPREDILLRTDEVLAEVGLEDLRDRNLQALSGGQKQKIAIASVLATRPEVLLLDEPTANLDPQARVEVLRLVVRQARKNGITVIMVEHNLEEVLDDIDCLLVMDEDGRVVAQGPRELVTDQLRDGRHDQLCAYLPRALWGHEEIHSVWEDETGEVEQAQGPVVLSVRDVAYAYPERKGLWRRTFGPQVLDGVSLQVRQDDFIAVVGRNGVGKSTLFNVIFRLYEPQRGSVELLGRDIRSMGKREIYRTMGLVFQNPVLQFVTNQVDDELLASLRDSDEPEDEKRRHVDAMLARYGLLPFAKESPFVLSQGQKRRLSVATMLLTNQRILFLDEPTYGQDQQNRISLMDEMVRLNHSGVAIVMITHDIDLIRRYARRVVMLEDGHVTFDAPVSDYVRLLDGGVTPHV